MVNFLKFWRVSNFANPPNLISAKINTLKVYFLFLRNGEPISQTNIKFCHNFQSTLWLCICDALWEVSYNTELELKKTGTTFFICFADLLCCLFEFFQEISIFEMTWWSPKPIKCCTATLGDLINASSNSTVVTRLFIKLRWLKY